MFPKLVVKSISYIMLVTTVGTGSKMKWELRWRRQLEGAERERDVWRLSNSHIGDKKDGKQSEKND